MKNKKREKVEVGQKLYLTVSQCGLRRGVSAKPGVVIVRSVGRKYFTLVEDGDTQYYIDTWKEKSIYSSYVTIYFNMLEWKNEKESILISSKLIMLLQENKENQKIPLSLLRKIDFLIKREIADD